MLITFTSDKSITEVAEALQKAVVANQYGVMQIHNLKQSMADKGVAFENECMIFEVCNPHSAKKVLDSNMAISTALPCRISVYTENGSTILATLKPSMMLSMFQAPEMGNVADDVENVMIRIMKEAASG